MTRRMSRLVHVSRFVFCFSGLTDSSAEHSVRPVRLDRCWAGTVRWSYPRGALRVVFRLTGAGGGREFRVCLKPDRLDGVRVLLDGAPRRLIPVYGHRATPAPPHRPRCFKSVGGAAAFYVEAADGRSSAGPVRFRYDLEPIATPAPRLFVPDDLDDGKWNLSFFKFFFKIDCYYFVNARQK